MKTPLLFLVAFLSLALPAPLPAKVRLTLKDLPPAVQATVQKSGAKGEVKRIYRGYDEGATEPSFHVILMGEDRQVILKIANDGKLLHKDEGPIPDRERSRQPPAGSILYGTFEGKFPCEDCQRVKVSLTLHQSEKDKAPTTYQLERVGVGKGNEVTVTRGRWKKFSRTIKGSDRTFVQLEGNTPPDYSLYLAVGKDLLLLSDPDLEPRIGDSSYSFTLSRTQ